MMSGITVTAMKTALAIGLLGLVVAFALPRVRRAAYDLPDGAVEVLGSIKTTFTCPDTSAFVGYYADVDNNCQIFHICEHIDGALIHTSFFCGNQTVFNQLTLTCATFNRAIPCNLAPQFYYLNEKIGQPNVQFLGPEDIAKARDAFQRG